MKVYESYKDSGVSWIGKIPASWHLIKTKYVADFMPACDFSKLSSKSEITFSPMECIKSGYFENRKTLLKDINGSYAQFSNGDIAMAKVTPCFENGNIAIMNGLYNGVGMGSSELFVLRAKKINTRFLFYFLQNPGFKQAGCATMTGTGGLKRVSSAFVQNCPIPYPPDDVQESIVNYLDDETTCINSLISEARASIEEYKVWKASIITEAVTNGLNPNAKMKESGLDWINMIPVHWNLVRIRNIGYTQNGVSKGGDYFGEGYPFVNYGDVYKNYSLPIKVSGLAKSTPEDRTNYSVKYGDIFFTRTSETADEVGFSSVCRSTIEDATFSGFVIRLRPYNVDSLILTNYAKYYFRSEHIRNYLVKEMNIVTRVSLSQSLLKDMYVTIPPLEEQEKIADYLDSKCASIDSLISEKEALISDLEAYKKSLIYEVVTGKRKVV